MHSNWLWAHAVTVQAQQQQTQTPYRQPSRLTVLRIHFCVHLFCAPNSNGVGHLSPAIHTNQQQAEAFPTTLEAQMMGMQCILEKKTIK